MHKYKFALFIITLIFSSTSANAGSQDSLYIMGWPEDAFTAEPVIDSTRAELLTLDSVVVATAIPTWNRQYRPNSSFAFTVGVRSGEFIVRVTNPKYETTTKRFTLKAGKREITYSIGTVKLRKKMKTTQLGEVSVTATKVKFYTKGDTLVYNADAFNLAEGSMLDALISQLPGVELKRDGRILVNGKQVESLLLNGKDFFSNDRSVLLDNLPAYTVQNIKVYNKLSDFEKMLSNNAGHKISDGEYVMDVILKREYQIGWLANVEAGGGTHERWLARLFALRYTPRSRLTIYANANNTHESRKPGNNGDWMPSEIGSGLTTSETGGLDYRIDDKQDRWTVQGDASVLHSSTDTETRQEREHFQSAGNTFTRNRQSGNNSSTSFTTNHNLRFNLGPEANKHALELHLRPKFNFRRDKSTFESLSAEFSENPFELDDWESVFYGTEAGKSLASILVNKVQDRQRSNTTSTDGGLASEVYYLIPRTPYHMIFTGGVNGRNIESNRFSLYNLEYAGQNDLRHRYFDLPARHIDANACVGISTPFDRGYEWVATTRVAYNYSHDRKENSLYRLDWIEEMADVETGTLPSTQNALMEALDRANSYLTEDGKHQVTVSFDGRYDNNIYRDNKKYARFRFTWKAGLTMQRELWDYDGVVRRRDGRTSWLPSLGLEVLRNTPGMSHELELQLSYSQQLPSMFSLMGLRFDSDPLNISIGNPDLRNTDVFRARFFYRPGQWAAKHRMGLSATADLHVYRNSVATAQTYDTETGVRTFQPENVNGNWNAMLYVNWSKRLGNKGFTVRASLHENFYNNVDLIGTDRQLPQRSTVRTNYISLPVRLEYSRNKVRVEAKTQIAWNHAESKRENFQTINAADFNVGVNGNITMPWNMQFATDLTYFKRFGYTYEEMNRGDLVWNAQLSKSIVHGNLVFSLIGYDILGQLSNITYTVNAQGTTETWRNVIPRYGMLRVIYKFHKQPKKRG